jgi:hypothetical protein
VKGIGALRKTLPTLVPRPPPEEVAARGGGRPSLAPRPSPASAEVVMKSQAEAMSTLQGQ